MASLQKEPTGTFHIVIRIDGQRFKRSLQTKNEQEARLRKDEMQETLELISRGRISVPDDCRTIDFLLKRSVKTSKPRKADEQVPSLTLKKLFEQFFDLLPTASLEKSSLSSMRTHEGHLIRLLGQSLKVSEVSSQGLQAYINRRAKEETQFFSDAEKTKRTLVSATTIRKELVTLRTVWNWGSSVSLLTNKLPNQGLRLPKTDEKPPFQTWKEIERQIQQDDLDASDADELWSCLYLRSDETASLLEYVKDNANHKFIYPMFAMAAFTGARRSELIRSRMSDFDFENDVLTIRERKRVKGRRSTRRIPITPKLKLIMQHWFVNDHPGGSNTFVLTTDRRGQGGYELSVNQAHCHFEHTLANSKWEKVKGWHCLRHSFISNLACAGVDQRMIDDFVGHTTDEMRRRYRHLFPELKHAALTQVFG